MSMISVSILNRIISEIYTRLSAGIGRGRTEGLDDCAIKIMSVPQVYIFQDPESQEPAGRFTQIKLTNFRD